MIPSRNAAAIMPWHLIELGLESASGTPETKRRLAKELEQLKADLRKALEERNRALKQQQPKLTADR